MVRVNLPRPKGSSKQQLQAFDLHRAGLGPTAIWEGLISEHGEDAVSLRTVNTWIRGFKDGANERNERGEPDLDVPFDWHRLEDYGLPWEAGDYLLRMWRWTTDTWGRLAVQNQRPPPSRPTARQARWWWRVHLAVPEVKEEARVHALAEHLVRFELFKEVVGETLDISGLSAYLAYRPWENEANRATYNKAVTLGHIAPPPTKTSYPAWEEFESMMQVLRDANKETEGAQYEGTP